jgi:glycerol kinase
MAPKADHIIAIDQGTTSSRARLFDENCHPLATAQRELPQIFPKPGWVEHDAERIWQDTAAVVADALQQAGVAASRVAAIGITNQRETVVLWDRKTGEALHNAIVWQDRRTADTCETLKNAGHEPDLQDRTGLLLDPYFSATKLAWLLDNVDGARARADRGELAAGTIDCFLLWRLTGGRHHATDPTNAARTLLFNIHTQEWDDDLLALFDIPRGILPEVRDSVDDFGETDPSLLGTAIPIRAILGDQQAATVGQACFAPGSAKCTFGTGCFALLNTGGTPLASQNRLLTTVAYRLDGTPTFALEGSIFIAGAVVQWLRDGLHLLASAEETDSLARQARPDSPVVMVPAFTGLGAPYWDSGARGAIFGLTRDTGPAEIVHAALTSVCNQTRDLLEAMRADDAPLPATLRVDGGMARNDWFLQHLSDLLGIAVERPTDTETTAHGAAYFAGMRQGLYPPPDAMDAQWQLDQRFEPAMDDAARDECYARWKDAVRRTRSDA